MDIFFVVRRFGCGGDVDVDDDGLLFYWDEHGTYLVIRDSQAREIRELRRAVIRRSLHRR